MTEKPVIETIQAQHLFTGEEQQTLAKSLVARMQEYSQSEAELDSIKQDYKAKLTRIETDRDTIAQKIRDGFEMRPCDAIVLFNTPSNGRKSYFQKGAVDPETKAPTCGAFVREECMSGPDFQRSLPLEEQLPAQPEPHESFDSAAAPAQSATVPPGGFALVTEGVSQQGDFAWSTAIDEWQEVAEPGTPFDSYQALCRPDAQPPTFSEETLQQRGQDAGSTPLGEALKAAAAGKDLPLVPVKLSSDFTADKARAQFRKAAKKNKWTEAAIDLLDDECMKATDPEDEPGSIKRVLEILNAHTAQEAK
jgi:hypothetical protein